MLKKIILLLFVVSAMAQTAPTSYKYQIADEGAVPLLLCSTDEHGTSVTGCKLREGESWDHVISIMLKTWRDQENSYNRCGDFGPWILDKNGKIMGRYKNPPCPK